MSAQALWLYWLLIRRLKTWLVREMALFQTYYRNELSNLIYNALWFSPATQALIAYIKETQKVGWMELQKLKLIWERPVVVLEITKFPLRWKFWRLTLVRIPWPRCGCWIYQAFWGLLTKVYSEVQKMLSSDDDRKGRQDMSKIQNYGAADLKALWKSG